VTGGDSKRGREGGANAGNHGLNRVVRAADEIACWLVEGCINDGLLDDGPRADVVIRRFADVLEGERQAVRDLLRCYGLESP